MNICGILVHAFPERVDEVATATCIDCHRGIAHRLPPGAQEAAEELDRKLGASRLA
jgi:hypothetical protein